MLIDHLDGILNYCRVKVRFGVVEAINGNIKTLLRAAVGTRIYVTCCSWVSMMRRHWKNPEDPTFRIRACCRNLISELENAVYSSQSDKDILTQTYKEKIEDELPAYQPAPAPSRWLIRRVQATKSRQPEMMRTK